MSKICSGIIPVNFRGVSNIVVGVSMQFPGMPKKNLRHFLENPWNLQEMSGTFLQTFRDMSKKCPQHSKKFRRWFQNNLGTINETSSKCPGISKKNLRNFLEISRNLLKFPGVSLKLTGNSSKFLGILEFPSNFQEIPRNFQEIPRNFQEFPRDF